MEYKALKSLFDNLPDDPYTLDINLVDEVEKADDPFLDALKNSLEKREDVNRLYDLALDLARAYELQGFLTGFNVASEILKESQSLFKGSEKQRWMVRKKAPERR